MKYNLLLLALFAAVLVSCKGEDLEDHHFGNKLYVSSELMSDDLLIRDVSDYTREISVRTAMPVEQDVQITFDAAPEMAATYNLIYGDNAGALPADYYDIPEKTTVIKSGSITGDNIVVNFTNINQLDKDSRYVLPVTIKSVSQMELLESTRTVYFVFKGAALINVVANISNMHFPVEWKEETPIASMSTVTVEALIRCQNWELDRENINSIFGIEGKFLIRIGDADRPSNQLQLVNPAGAFPAPNVAPGLPVNEWVHIALVYDTTTGDRIYYINGNPVAADMNASSSISLKGSCYIGKSWNDDRWFNGDIAELRVWNIQRTQEEIAGNQYSVNPQTPGLVAYWKFNDGNGSLVKDHSVYENNVTGSAAPKWVSVELPED